MIATALRHSKKRRQHEIRAAALKRAIESNLDYWRKAGYALQQMADNARELGLAY